MSDFLLSNLLPLAARLSVKVARSMTWRQDLCLLHLEGMSVRTTGWPY